MILEIHKTPGLKFSSSPKEHTTQASLTSFASAEMFGLLRSIIGMDIALRKVSFEPDKVKVGMRAVVQTFIRIISFPGVQCPCRDKGPF